MTLKYFVEQNQRILQSPLKRIGDFEQINRGDKIGYRDGADFENSFSTLSISDTKTQRK